MKTLKRILAALLLVAVMVGMFSVSALASTTKYTSANVNLRKSASISSKVLTTIKSNVKLTVLSSKTDDRGVTWYKVTYNKKTGYVSSLYCKDSKSSDGKKTKLSVSGKAYIRKSANKSSKKLDVIHPGEVATYLNKTATDSRGVKWYKVTFGSVTGWVSSKNVKKIW